MLVYFIKFTVVPCSHNTHNITAEGAYAFCWVVANDPISALAKSKFLVEKDEWNIDTIDNEIVPVSREFFANRETGEKNYDLALLNGISVYYVAWSKEVSEEKELNLNIATKLNKSQYYKQRGIILKEGRCLHFDSGDNCDQIIKAHSIQRNQSLANIATNSHVYQISNQRSIKNNNKLVYELEGINKASTFRGFCKKHDNELFEPIDNSPLTPSDEQVFLYAYRSISREVFEKSKALSLSISLSDSYKNDCAEQRLIDKLIEGTSYGLEQLIAIKESYDVTLKSKSFSDIKFVVFKCNQEPNIAFSGLIYPDFDFLGNHLQHLDGSNGQLSLLTFCSAPMIEGWGYILAWHQENSATCDTFISSLTQVIRDGNCVEDALFRFVISSCENHAFSPIWWDALDAEKKDKVVARVNEIVDPMSIILPSYLKVGLEGIINWSFEEVHTNLEPYI